MTRLRTAFAPIEKATKNIGLQINEDKTKYIYVFNKSHANPYAKVDIKFNNYTFEGASDFGSSGLSYKYQQ